MIKYFINLNRKVKHKLLLLIVFVGLAPGLLAQTSMKPKHLKPGKHIKRLSTVSAEKTRYYYSLSDKDPSTISLEGPGKLRVITRARFVSSEEENLNYEIIYSLDGAAPKVIEMNSKSPAKEAHYLNTKLGKPGQLKDFEIDLGRSHHTINFKRSSGSPPVAARYFFTPSRAKKTEWIAYSPLQPSEPVNLISRESLLAYYRFTEEQPLFVTVNGPTQLRVLTRIENHFQMKGRIHYRVQVKENAKVSNTYQLSSRRSDVTVYEVAQDLIPGKACEFVINVPNGRHSYQIVPLDQDKKSVLARCLLPKKDVQLIE
jgi:hypothetical protein